MTPNATTLVERWLDRLVACDVPGLVDLYDPRAEMRALHETWKGHAEIENGLTFASRWIRGVQVEGVEPVTTAEGVWTFDTTVKGRLGRAKVRHTWTLTGEHIQDHALSIVRHDKHGV